MWKEWMSTVWREGRWWPKSVGDGYEETEVGLDGWCEGGPREQRNDGGGCSTKRERSERVESPGTCNWISFTWLFCLALCSFGPPSLALVIITWIGMGCRYMMRMGDIVKKAQLLKIKAQVSSIWAKGCMLKIVCVLSDLTWLLLLGGERKSLYIIITDCMFKIVQCSLSSNFRICLFTGCWCGYLAKVTRW